VRTAEVRLATADDAGALGALRHVWSPPSSPSTSESREEFAVHLETWMRDRSDSLVCVVAEDDGVLVGMAWLVIFERVPNPGQPRRLHGDVQSVFVTPEFRGQGLGYKLVRAICDAADERGLAKVGVFANDRALTLYQRVGFRASGVLLERDLGA